MDAKDRARFINALNETAVRPGEETVSVREMAAPEPSVAAADRNEDAKSVFASGLPNWDIVPPQVVVRRKRRI